MEQSALATKYVKVPVSVLVNGVYIDPTGDTVQLAFPVRGVDPVGGDWKSAIWETVDITTHEACCLVGPSGGTVQLSKGAYDVWVKVVDNPEIPVEKAGFLRIT